MEALVAILLLLLHRDIDLGIHLDIHLGVHADMHPVVDQ